MLRAFAASALLLCSTAHAHFQLLLPPGELALTRPSRSEIYLPFTHPADSGEVMPTEAPAAFFVVHRGKQTDLVASLRESTFSSAANTGASWVGEAVFKRLGDHVLVLEPAPYFEVDEEMYIQQITKTVINVGGLPTDWDVDVGLPVELRPLMHPSAVWAGGVFQAQVLRQGEPVPHAEIEVEFLNYPIDSLREGFGQESLVTIPVPLLETQIMRADASGIVTVGVPHAGRWGIAALDLLPGSEHNGKPLSVDAVLWIDVRGSGSAR